MTPRLGLHFHVVFGGAQNTVRYVCVGICKYNNKWPVYETDIEWRRIVRIARVCGCQIWNVLAFETAHDRGFFLRSYVRSFGVRDARKLRN